jgi:hypothetical protein
MRWAATAFVSALIGCTAATTANAVVSGQTDITFDVSNVGGNTFEFVYTVENVGLSVAIEEFTIFFDVSLFENLALPSAPSGFDPIVVQPDPALPDDGFFDVLASPGPGIASGASLGGFSVRADFLGTGTPGPQPFEIIEPTQFAVLDGGLTRPAGIVVSEPSSMMILGLGILIMIITTRRRRST